MSERGSMGQARVRTGTWLRPWLLAGLLAGLGATGCGLEPVASEDADAEAGADATAEVAADVPDDAGPDAVADAAGPAADAQADVQGDAAPDSAADADEAGTADAVAPDVVLDTQPDAQPDTADAPDAPDDADAAGADADAAGTDAGPACPASCGPPPACQAWTCAAGACVAVPLAATTPCDDGEPCTSGDTCCLAGAKNCVPGTCKPGPNQCQCSGQDEAQCEQLLGDFDLCNGVLYCDTSALPYKCAQLPGSVVVCDASGDSECAKAACDPASGKCVAKPANQGDACDKANLCAQSECDQGQCVATVKKCACLTNADCAAQDAGDLCNGTHYCDKSVPGKWQCKVNPATVVDCPTSGDTACAKNVCVPKTGQCVLTPVELVDCTALSGKCKPLGPGVPPDGQDFPCSDGSPCSTGDLCQGGQCQPGTNTCACQADADCAAKEDGNACNGTLYCDKSTGKCELNPATVVTCPSVDDTACLQNQCQTVTGSDGKAKAACQMTAINQGKPCNDGDLCTTGDSCLCASGASGDATCQCVPGSNTCTCQTDADCAAQDDGNLCNGTMFCDKTQAQPVCKVNPATVVHCPSVDDTACSQNLCQPKTGQCQVTAVHEGQLCEADGNPCTANDTCQAGKCVASAGFCACQANADCAKFEDGDACNGTLYCDKSGPAPACKVNPKTVVQCPGAAGPCLASVCDTASGQCLQVPAHDQEPCDADGSPCTKADVCQGGQCVPGANVCSCLVNADCAAQDDANPCNGTLYCDKTASPAECKVNPATVVACPASSAPCAANACNPATGKCEAQPLADGLGCTDGNPCTTGDACTAGQCVPGADTCACQQDGDCLDDGNACNGTPYCDKSQAPFQCQVNPATVVTCPGAAQGCNLPVCQALSGQCLVQPQPSACDDQNPCTIDGCSAGACQHSPVADATPCGPGAACLQGQCLPVPKDMVLVPGGTTWMGCNAATDPQCLADEKPQHAVAIAPLFADRFEVTAGHYQACVAAGACPAAAGTGAQCNPGKTGRAKHPVNCLTWAQAEAVCQWTGKRLPTEAEWERLARGTCDSPGCKTEVPRYPWGDLPLPACSQTVLAGAAKPGCDTDATFAVGSRPADKSAWGLFDLGGNVREWTADTYAADFYAQPAASGPEPKNGGPGSIKSVRGGGAASAGIDVRAGARGSHDAAGWSPWLGVRCVVAAKP